MGHFVFQRGVKLRFKSRIFLKPQAVSGEKEAPAETLLFPDERDSSLSFPEFRVNPYMVNSSVWQRIPREWSVSIPEAYSEEAQAKGEAFPADTISLKPSGREFMINYRVENIEGLLEELKVQGVEVLDDLAAYEFGKSAHIMDSEGNKTELLGALANWIWRERTRFGGLLTRYILRAIPE